MSQESKAMETVLNVVERGATLASALLPQYRVYLVLGATVARQFPELYRDVERLLQKEEPTEQEKTELWRKLRALQNPETIQ